MIPHTKAFKKLKEQAQSTFNFAILVCYAVPNFKVTLKGVQPGVPLNFTPEHFDNRPIPIEKVANHISEYKEILSKQIFLSSFTYFESYFIDAIKEIIEFHGREHLLGKGSLKNNLNITDPESTAAVRKLQEYPLTRNKGRYIANNDKLTKKGFRLPSALLSHYGLEQLYRLVDSDNVRAADIPALIGSVLQLPISKEETEKFKSYKDIRNRIAHGKAENTDFYLRMAIEMNDFLRNLALKIDGHIVKNFFIIEM